MKKRLLNILFFLVILTIVLGYYFVDRQVVLFLVNINSRQYGFLKFFANSITYFLTVVVFLYYMYIAIKVLKNKIDIINKKLITICNSIVITAFLKNIFKLIFGRYWTATFQNDNLSFVNDGMYGFNFLSSGSDFGSFPSGHTAFIFAFAISSCILFPRLKYLFITLAVLVSIGQIGMYYHFVSDVIAGSFLGGVVAFIYTKYKFDKINYKLDRKK